MFALVCDYHCSLHVMCMFVCLCLYLAFCLQAFGRDICTSGFVILPEFLKHMWILGDMFLGAYFTELDMGNRRLAWLCPC